MNARRLSHFSSKSVGGGLTSRGEPEKTQKVTRGSHRNDVSPLTQGLRYRAACDSGVRSQRRKANACVIAQREPGGERYVRPGTAE